MIPQIIKIFNDYKTPILYSGGSIAKAFAQLIVGFFIARRYMMKYLKKNPPINEEMIKALMTQMGRKPSQKQVNQLMKSMGKYM